MLYINVPFSDKDEAKALGAKWNTNAKKWFITNKCDYYKFAKWFPEHFDEYYIICDYIYLVEKERKCPYCKFPNSEVKVAIPHYYYFYEEPDEYGNTFEYSHEEPRIVSLKTVKQLICGDLRSFMKKRYLITVENDRLCQYCLNCHRKLTISPSYSFAIYSIDEVSDYTLLKYKIIEDVIVEYLEWCSSDVYIVKYGTKLSAIDIQ